MNCPLPGGRGQEVGKASLAGHGVGEDGILTHAAVPIAVAADLVNSHRARGCLPRGDEYVHHRLRGIFVWADIGRSRDRSIHTHDVGGRLRSVHPNEETQFHFESTLAKRISRGVTKSGAARAANASRITRFRYTK